MISDRFDETINEEDIKNLLSSMPTRILKQTVLYRGFQQEVKIDALSPPPISGEGLVVVDEGGRDLDEWLKDNGIQTKHNETLPNSNSLAHMFATSLTEIKLYHLNKYSPYFIYYQSLSDDWREKYGGYESPLKLFDIKDFYEFHPWLKCCTSYYN